MDSVYRMLGAVGGCGWRPFPLGWCLEANLMVAASSPTSAAAAEWCWSGCFIVTSWFAHYVLNNAFNLHWIMDLWFIPIALLLLWTRRCEQIKPSTSVIFVSLAFFLCVYFSGKFVFNMWFLEICWNWTVYLWFHDETCFFVFMNNYGSVCVCVCVCVCACAWERDGGMSLNGWCCCGFISS